MYPAIYKSVVFILEFDMFQTGQLNWNKTNNNKETGAFEISIQKQNTKNKRSPNVKSKDRSSIAGLLKQLILTKII